jgi:hypothetical protein
MRFFNRILGSLSEGSRTRDRRFTDQRRSRIELEMLEGRTLMSGIPGVSLRFGNLAITAPNASGNVAQVSIDPSNHDVKVSLNGKSEEFSPSLVASVTYKGGSGGGDTFTNDTYLVEQAYGYGGHNTFTGGTTYNFVYFFGNSNTYQAQAGSFCDVFENGGKGDTIHDPPGATIWSVS